MDGPGWAYRAGGDGYLYFGTVSLAIPAILSADGDTAVVYFIHQGAGWAVMPAGWNLVGQTVFGANRAEMYWHRIDTAADPVTISITGLAGFAMGGLTVYSGGLSAGDLLDGASVGVITGPASGTAVHAPSITPTVEQTLLLVFAAFDWTEDSPPTAPFAHLGTASAPEDVADYGTSDLRWRVRGGSSHSQGLYLMDGIKIVPVPTGDIVGAGTTINPIPGGNHLATICCALKPDPVAVPGALGGTRYFLSSKIPSTPIEGPQPIAWNCGWPSGGVASWFERAFHGRLSQSKTDAGLVVFTANRFGTNEAGDVIAFRHYTPPLAAQTIAGTFNLLVMTGREQSNPPPNPTVYYKVHIYITVGQTTAVRAVLLDEYIDPTAWAGSLSIFRALTGPVALASAACQAGDSVCVELGAHITLDVPYGTPHRPVDEWTAITMGMGAGQIWTTQTLFVSSVPMLLGVPGDFIPGVGYYDFSHTFVEQAPSGVVPANVTGLTAEAIPALPFTATLDTSRAPSADRRVWYTWTAPADETILVFVNGSAYGTRLAVFDALSPQTTPSFLTELVELTDRHCVLNTVTGKTYYFAIRAIGGTYSAPSSGGRLSFLVARYQAPALNDVIVASQNRLLRYTEDGLLAGLVYAPFKTHGLAFDFSGRPMTGPAFGGGTRTDTGIRVLVGEYGNNQVFVYPLDRFGVGVYDGSFIDYISNPWYYNGSWVLDLHPGELIAALDVDRTGRLVAAHYGNGYTRFCTHVTGFQTNATVLMDAATNDTAALLLADASLGDNQVTTPPPRVTQIPAVEHGGVNFIKLARDGETLWYTSNGFYLPSGGTQIKRWNVTTGVQLPDFATIPTGGGPTVGPRAICPLSDGGCLVTSGTLVYRLDSGGTIVQTYTPPGALMLVALAVTQGDAAFWTLDDHRSTLWKIDMTTGAVLVTVPLTGGYSAFDTTDLLVYVPPIVYEDCPCTPDPWTLGP